MPAAAARRRVDRVDQHNPPQRSSLADLIAALLIALPVGLYLFFIMALAVGSRSTPPS